MNFSVAKIFIFPAFKVSHAFIAQHFKELYLTSKFNKKNENILKF